MDDTARDPDEMAFAEYVAERAREDDNAIHAGYWGTVEEDIEPLDDGGPCGCMGGAR